MNRFRKLHNNDRLIFRLLWIGLIILSLAVPGNTNQLSLMDSGVNVGHKVMSHAEKASNSQGIVLINVAGEGPKSSNRFLSFLLVLSELDAWQASNISIYDSQTEHLLKICQSQRVGLKVVNSAEKQQASAVLGINSCYIPNQNLSEGEVLKVYVKCEDSCKFTLQTQWLDMKILQVDSVKEIAFNNADLIVKDYLYRVSEPPKDQHFTSLRITLMPDLIDQPSVSSTRDAVQLYASNDGNLPTQTEHNYSGVTFTKQIQGNNSQDFAKSSQATELIIRSQQLNYEKPLYLYVIGQSQRKYVLSYTIEVKQHRELVPSEFLYDTIIKHSSAKYHIRLQNLTSQSNDSYYVIKVSAIRGQVESKFYSKQLEEQKNLLDSSKSFYYMGDSEFTFPIKDLKQLEIKQLFLSLYSGNEWASFALYLQKKSSVEASEIKDNVYEFIEVKGERLLYMDATKSVQKLQIQYIRARKEDQANKILVLTAEHIDRLGNITAQFYFCSSKDPLIECLKANLSQLQDQKGNTIKLVDQIIQSKIGKKEIYTLKINITDSQIWKHNLDSVQNIRYFILVHLKGQVRQAGANKTESLPCISMIRIKDKTKVQEIRIGKVTDRHLTKDDSQTYLFQHKVSNQNQERLSKVKILINVISGKLSYYVVRTLSETLKFEHLQKSAILQTIGAGKGGKSIEITQNLTEPIYLETIGIEETIFSISVQTLTGQTEGTTKITPFIMNEDIEYKIVLPPQAMQMLEIHPMFQFLSLKWEASGAIALCSLKNRQSNCLAQDIKNLDKKGMVAFDQINLSLAGAESVSHIINTQNKTKLKRVQYIRIVNVSPDKSIDVNLLTHSGPETKCIIRSLNRAYTDIVPNGKCIAFHLFRQEDVEVMISLNEMGTMHLTGVLCDQPLQLNSINGSNFIISKELIKQKCQKIQLMRIKKQKSLIISIASREKTDQKIKINYLVQYVNEETLVLPEGTAYQNRILIKDHKVKQFEFVVLNKVETTVIGIVKEGAMKFYAKLVDGRSYRQRHEKINENEYHFSSEEGQFFYRNPMIKITPELYKKHGGDQCGNFCRLLIVVFATSEIEQYLSYSIEIVQNSITLKDHQPFSTFVPKGSAKYFQYESKEDNQTMIVTVSDLNRGCAMIYFGKKEFPNKDKSLVKETGNQLAYAGSKGMYYIGIEALENDCPLSVSVGTTKFKLENLALGRPALIKLKDRQKQYFFFRNDEKKPFKLVSIQKYNSIKIYVNQSTQQTLNQLILRNELPVQKFKIVNKYANSLQILPTDPGFCSACHYVVAIEATGDVQGSLMLVNEQVPIKLVENKMFFDEIESNGQTLINFYDILKGKVCVTMYKGGVQVKLRYKEKQQNMNFSFHIEPKVADSPESSQLHCQDLDLTVNGTSEAYNWQPVKLTVKNVNKTTAVYQLSLIQDKIERLQPLRTGFPTFLYLLSNDTQCVAGHLTSKTEKIYISTDNAFQPLLSSLLVEAMIDNTTIQKFEKRIVDNIIQIFLNLSQFQISAGLELKLCINSAQLKMDLPLTVMQSSRIMLLPDSYDYLISSGNKDQNFSGQEFMLHPDQAFILDIFECGTDQDGVQTAQSSDLKFFASEDYNLVDSIDLNNEQMRKKMQTLGTPSTFGDQSHAVYIESYGTLFVKVFQGSMAPNNNPSEKGQRSIIRWFQVNEDLEIGMGYHIYRRGQINYDSGADSIDFSWQQVHPSTETKTTITSQIYTLYISDSVAKVKSAANCRFKSHVNFYYKTVTVTTENLLKDHQVRRMTTQIIKKDLNVKFSQFDREKNLYVILVAEVLIDPPKIQKQHLSPGVVAPSQMKTEYYKFIYPEIQIPAKLLLDSQFRLIPLILIVVAILVTIPGCLFCGHFFVTRVAPVISKLRTQAMVEQSEDDQKSAKKSNKTTNKDKKQQNKKYDPEPQPIQDFEMPMPTDQRMIPKRKTNE